MKFSDREKLLILLGAAMGACSTERFITKKINQAFGTESWSYSNMAQFAYSSLMTRKLTEDTITEMSQESVLQAPSASLTEFPGQYL